MSEDARRPEYTPLNLHPFVGLDLGERWGREVGELSQRLTHVEQAVTRLESKTDALSAKVEDIAHIVARHDERFTSLERSLDERFASLERSLDERFGRMDDKFRHMDEKFGYLDEKFGRQDDKIAYLGDKFASLEKRLDHNAKLLWGLFTAMLAAIIIQKFI